MSRPHEGTPPDLWDPVVRVSHWVIAGVVVGNALLTKGGGTVHVWLGWIGMVFLILRLVWGLVGSVEARFAAFPPRPGAAIAHIRHLLKGKPPEYRSHNPAGAMMIYALWASLAIVIGTGVVLTKGATPWEIARQQAAVATGDWSALVTEGDFRRRDGRSRRRRTPDREHSPTRRKSAVDTGGSPPWRCRGRVCRIAAQYRAAYDLGQKTLMRGAAPRAAPGVIYAT